MPFTPAHVSIVLPLLRLQPQFVSATALVIGSIAPDFEYFLKMSVNGEYSHTLLGILYFNIPITIVLSFLFHGVVKQNLIRNLPVFFQYRLENLRTFNFKKSFQDHYGIFIISAGLGSGSHLFWDAFTHNDGYFAQRISLYKEVVIPFDGVRYPLFYGLQHISTWVGLTVLLLYIFMMKTRNDITISHPSIRYWVFIFLIYAVVVFLRFIFVMQSLNLGNFVVSSISAMVVALLLGGLIKFKRV